MWGAVPPPPAPETRLEITRRRTSRLELIDAVSERSDTGGQSGCCSGPGLLSYLGMEGFFFRYTNGDLLCWKMQQQ